ncbi:fucolectin-like isoform X2 [Colossoma macropomum]|uniref:fucolectin-like isoform X2 n=1 Tax=Colossoma macropomum TaxID=42526 RepID=UPI001864FD56|nr:fucolectin-like isoform X2 [Colossoma macropomum]
MTGVSNHPPTLIKQICGQNSSEQKRTQHWTLHLSTQAPSLCTPPLIQSCGHTSHSKWSYQIVPATRRSRTLREHLPRGEQKFLTLCEVQVFADVIDEQKASLLPEKAGLRNVALRGRATQSSLNGSGMWAGFGIAGNAIDGNRNSNLMMGSCTETAQESAPWWRVNLHRKYTISTVALTNRGDCCPEGLDGAEIRIGNSIENEGKDNPLCATVSSIPAGQTEYFNCSTLLEGSYVTVFLPREGTLSLCEVEVFGVPLSRRRN